MPVKKETTAGRVFSEASAGEHIPNENSTTDSIRLRELRVEHVVMTVGHILRTFCARLVR